MAKYKVLVISILIVAAFLGVGIWLSKSSTKTPQDLPGQSFESQGQAHIAEGSTEHEPYNSNPPTSGPHWPAPAAWGVYPGGQPDERLVHNLEHGGIWISYHPEKVDQNTINLLNDFTKRYGKIIVEPRPKNDAAISLAAWTFLQNLDQYDDSTIVKFINAHYDQGPEKVP
jgi:hypothetical protein